MSWCPVRVSLAKFSLFRTRPAKERHALQWHLMKITHATGAIIRTVCVKRKFELRLALTVRFFGSRRCHLWYINGRVVCVYFGMCVRA